MAAAAPQQPKTPEWLNEAEKELKRIDVLMKTLMDETVVEDDAVATVAKQSRRCGPWRHRWATSS